METYFEVSPRRSGKSTRLLAAAALTDNPIVVCMNEEHASDLRRMRVVKHAVFIGCERLRNADGILAELGLEFDQVSWFFDEFDFHSYQLPAIPGAYYSTTASKMIKQDLLTELHYTETAVRYKTRMEEVDVSAMRSINKGDPDRVNREIDGIYIDTEQVMTPRGHDRNFRLVRAILNAKRTARDAVARAVGQMDTLINARKVKEVTPGNSNSPSTKSEGMKFDNGKPDWSLLELDILDDTVKVLGFGAKKYAKDNWKKVEDGKNRYYSALVRHMVAYRSGERLDPESGLPHLAHAMCCLIFLTWLEKKDKKKSVK